MTAALSVVLISFANNLEEREYGKKVYDANVAIVKQFPTIAVISHLKLRNLTNAVDFVASFMEHSSSLAFQPP